MRVFETSGLEFTSFLLLLPECWDYGPMPLCLEAFFDNVAWVGIAGMGPCPTRSPPVLLQRKFR